MRKELVLTCAVGRGMPIGITTFYTCAKTSAETCERRADAAEDSKLRELVKSGVAPERVVFSRIARDVADAPVVVSVPVPLGFDVQAVAKAAAEAAAAIFAGQLAAQQAEIDALRAEAKAAAEKAKTKAKSAAKSPAKKGGK